MDEGKEPLDALTYCEITSAGDQRSVRHPADDVDPLKDFVVGREIVGRYVLRSELGRGGMGMVFLARDSTLDRDVAIKVELKPSLDSVEPRDGQPDLAREARIAAILRHEGIASVFDFGIHASRPFTIFEYIEGQNLRRVMASKQGWTVGEVLQLVDRIADALDFAHAEGVVHSDLKPENICIRPDGSPVILDFGIARNLKTDADDVTFRGTAAYASPEQAGGRALDGRSDQYALGLIAYELLAGRRPFLDDDPLMQLHKHEYEQPPSIQGLCGGISPAVAMTVMRSLEKEPAARYATCREFAAALRDASSESPEIVRPSSRELHISETSADSLVARRLSLELEKRGFRTWYYQRDALPGIPLSRQVLESLQSTRAALVLISRSSLASLDFAEEVMTAHRLGRSCLPILVGMSLEEFESHQPIWRAALGSSAVIELERDTIEATLDRIEAAVTHLGIKPGAVDSVAEARSRSTSIQIWATDANQIEISEIDKIVFRNEGIDEFLNRRNRYFLSATKGLGKTLLLTYKRRLLTERSGSDDMVCLIPTGRPYLDFMSEMKLLSAKFEKPLSDLSTCKRLWGAALRISIMSHESELLDEDQYFELQPFPPRIQRWLKGATVEPTVVFKELTSMRISDVNRLIDGTENFLDGQIRQVHDSVLMFVDKVDQAVRRMSRPAWINIQAGLIEAAWDLMNANSHIKVFASIRQEAFANYESDIKTNLFGATTVLRYSDDDLRGLVDRLSGCYEGTEGFKEFVGVNVIKHPRRPLPEDSFEFLRRFTLGRPRDFVAIASELSSGRTSLDEERYCNLIRNTSAMALVANVFEETQVFLDCLHDKSRRLKFLSQIPANILSREEAVAASARFNGIPEDSFWHFDEESPDIFHPFRDLYLTGLLGVVTRDEQDAETQRFRQPDDVFNDAARDLPKSTHYFIHPALGEYIQQYKQAGAFRIVQHVLVGDNAPWQAFDPTFCQIESEIAKVNERELRDDAHAILTTSRTILLSAKPTSLRVEMEVNTDWIRTREKLLRHGYDDVILWIEELLK